ncbi:MAG TPA: GDSL-type esterase/lipase family protein [Candidatus Paceibacterota bacterium]|nr:GDSL-type esterase/lipase family protein [Candidatus Paceibacterota bacterium]
MTVLVHIIGILILSIVAFWGANTFLKARISKALMEHEEPYMNETLDQRKTLLVLGDSTGVGVGADKPEHSVAGRLAAYLGATYVENHAVSGALTEELSFQIQEAKLPKYDYILLQIGGNDILAFHSAKKTAAQLSTALGKLPPAGQIIIMSAGNAGGGTLFPPPLRPFHTLVNLAVHKEFARVAHGWRATYVNLFDPFWKDPFLRNPYRYLSRDGLHPSSYGYGLWFEKVKEALEKE